MPLTGAVSPPMANGEVIFEFPWQSRVFGMARSLCESGCFEWDEFRERLIAEIGTFDEAADDYRYFDHFLAAFSRLLDEKQICLRDDLEKRSGEFSARPHGHDH